MPGVRHTVARCVATVHHTQKAEGLHLATKRRSRPGGEDEALRGQAGLPRGGQPRGGRTKPGHTQAAGAQVCGRWDGQQATRRDPIAPPLQFTLRSRNHTCFGPKCCMTCDQRPRHPAGDVFPTQSVSCPAVTSTSTCPASSSRAAEWNGLDG